MKNVFTAIIFVLTYGIVDSIFTILNLNREVNPVVLLAVNSYGIAGLITLKLIGIFSILITFAILKSLNYSKTGFAMLLLSAISGIAVCLSNFLSFSYYAFTIFVSISFSLLPIIAVFEHKAKVV